MDLKQPPERVVAQSLLAKDCVNQTISNWGLWVDFQFEEVKSSKPINKSTYMLQMKLKKKFLLSKNGSNSIRLNIIFKWYCELGKLF